MKLYLTIAMIMTSGPALAHSSSDAFIRVIHKGEQVTLSVSVSPLDLYRRFRLDDNQDRAVSWGELQAHEGEVRDYLKTRLSLKQPAGPCTLTASGMGIDALPDANYLRLAYLVNCPQKKLLPLTVAYSGWYEVDAQHRGLVSVETESRKLVGAVGIDQTEFEFGDQSEWMKSFRKFVVEGIQHIFSGYDHILFIICLLLPAVYVRRHASWELQPDFRSASVEVLKALTAFTISHSLTLALSTFGLLPAISRNLVEIGVAISILFTALNNVFVWVSGRQVAIAFLFGLIHGIGFSSVLNDLGLSGWELLVALLAFNIGVEIAQIIVVLVVLPSNFVFRASSLFQRLSLVGGSLLTAVFATILIWRRL